MSLTPPDDGKKRMSPVVKLALVGVGSAALLYSCSPAIGGLTALPFIMGMGNPFYRPPVATTCPPGTPNCTPQGLTGSTGTGSTSTGSSGVSAFRGSTGSSISSPGTTSSGPSTGTTTSQRGGFGSTASSHGSGGSS